ncbi:tripartite tricarboxylate transporter substrate binding protein [Paralcaligenes sp. KSB-10]|uniref:Bug family tripartite tricarboxylate transporter substrate binding protein n=1 Tax=Paralcaligenes sp. KSB-10 TaxID=2901142 RepID=UPI001E5EA4C8|nr:tripartite tricarboxylate transporter substrate binding protein [Paralcaligenes sp. KSB-10]UHL65758.1 tripartite tricarboxylate transporter substrate binding protein [Paralcaligenes sp. KSB-10]
MKKSLFCSIATAAIIGGAFVPAHAESAYPVRPIRLLVGFAAGGPTDVIARVLAKDMSVTLKQNIYVENKVGATGMIAIREVKNAAPDGYTLLFSAPGLNVDPLIMGKKAGFDPKTDFAPISNAATLPMVIINAYSSPIKTLPELLEQARTKPGTVSFGSSGIGGPGHLAGELLATRAKVKMMHVPFKGNGPALLEVMAGRVDFIFYPMLGIPSNVAAKRIKILAVGTPKRLPQFPDVPTMSEAGFPGFEETAPWVGMLAPAHTPPAIINRLNEAMVKALAKPDVKAQLENLGAVIVGDTPAEFASYLKRDYSRWESVIKAAAIKPEDH